MKSVYELNQNELEELRSNYFYNEEIQHDFQDVFEVKNNVLFEYYEHTYFVEEDFWVNIKSL